IDLTLCISSVCLSLHDLVPSILFQNSLYWRDPGERKNMEPNRCNKR
ncbi:unnamed protein product, partial [Brassica oleracea]